MGLKKLIEACWYGQSPGILYPLLPLELLFKRLSAKRKQKLESEREALTVPVVVIGNIVVGGTGKTPVLIAIAQFLKSQGLRPGVISRGYGRASKSLHIVSPASTPDLAGDEPLEIFQATACTVVVSEDRNFALSILQQSADIDVVLSDDGMQHYGLNRHLEVAIFNQFHGLGNSHCLPLGPLREPPSRLDTINFILINQATYSHPSLKSIGDHFCTEFRIAPVKWVHVNTGQEKPLNSLVKELKGKKVCAVAGLGQPKKFFTTLSELGISFTKKIKKDHAYYRASDFNSGKYHTYLMTAKDAVKCKGLAPKNSWFLQVEAVLTNEFKSEFMFDLKELMSNKAQ